MPTSHPTSCCDLKAGLLQQACLDWVGRVANCESAFSRIEGWRLPIRYTIRPIGEVVPSWQMMNERREARAISRSRMDPSLRPE